MNDKTKLLLVIVISLQALFLASCKAKCLHGYVMEGRSCKKIMSDAGDGNDAGGEPDAMTAGGDRIATQNRSSDGGADAASDAAVADAAADESESKDRKDGGSQPPSEQPSTDAGRPVTGTNTSANQAEPEACPVEGATRCAGTSGQRNRETCQGKAWMASEACSASETCVTEPTGATCAAIEQLCVGSAGKPVCDEQGQMLTCNVDGTVASREMCTSARHCQAGLTGTKCPVCIPNEEHRCTEASLEVCANDGMSFTAMMQCPSAALCNPSLGMCSDAVCLPGMFTCEGNVLKQCKADSTGFDDATAMACGARTCDAQGGDCNMCQPGMKSCMGNSAMTCDPTGQRLDASPCANGMKCIGAGQCVACTEDSECRALNADCEVGACEQYRCVAMDAPRGSACTTSGRPGTCASGGECRCTPQCDKPCGEDGCGGQCRNTCGSLMCVNDECVECTSSSQCEGSADGCQVGVCNRDGNCTLSSDGTDGDACRINNMSGTCSGGSCVLPPPPPPPPTQNWTTCSVESDCSSSPNTTCHVSAKYCVPPCGSNNSCSGGRSCLEGWCLIQPMPGCPAGLSEIEIDAYTPTGKAMICATPGGV